MPCVAEVVNRSLKADCTDYTQLKRQSVEAWQNEKHHSKENNTSENPIPRREIFKSVDHVKYEGQVRSQHLLFVQFSC